MNAYRGVKPPDGPHLALIDGATLSGTAIPVGSLMYIVIDPTDISKVHPMVLLRVTNSLRIEFRCACGLKDCTRIYSFRPTMSGFHPSIHKR